MQTNMMSDDQTNNPLAIEEQKDSSPSRRDFLRGLTFGAVALATQFNLRFEKTLRQNNGRKLGIALLGLGRYSTGELGPALRQTKLCQLTGVVTGHPEKGE